MKVWREKRKCSPSATIVLRQRLKSDLPYSHPRKVVMMEIYHNNMYLKHMMENTYERIKVYSILAESKRE